MSSCAKYIKPTYECQDILSGYTREAILKQNRDTANYNIYTKNFSLQPDTSFYKTPQGLWTSCDPRLSDPVRGLKTSLSTPPLKVDIGCNLQNRCSEAKPQVYTTIADINLGDSIYYYNTEMSQPYKKINYSIPVDIDKEIFVDPMTSVKPIYFRRKDVYSIGDYQPTRDELCFREDIMERYMRKYNQQNYEVFHN